VSPSRTSALVLPARARAPARTRTRGRARSRVCAATLAAAALVAALALVGCGLGAGRAPGGVQLLVTAGFGARVLGSWSSPSVRGEESVMSVLRRNARVDTRYGGGFVQSIDGLSGGHESGAPVDWFYYVNGVEAAEGAAATKARDGDHIWWDRHDWSQTDHIPAVVGSFPEPFLHGISGKRLPVRVQCASVHAPACQTVLARLREAGVPVGVAALGGGGGPHTLAVVVAPWSAIAGDPTVSAIARGPAASGVYARFSADGAALTPLDASGSPAGARVAGSGLVAATRSGEDAPTWVVTGTDAAGVALAARAFDAASLDGHFALALTPAGALPLPIASPAPRSSSTR
jgi:Domain of unknown function (DUF4430)